MQALHPLKNRCSYGNGAGGSKKRHRNERHAWGKHDREKCAFTVYKCRCGWWHRATRRD